MTNKQSIIDLVISYKNCRLGFEKFNEEFNELWEVREHTHQISLQCARDAVKSTKSELSIARKDRNEILRKYHSLQRRYTELHEKCEKLTKSVPKGCGGILKEISADNNICCGDAEGCELCPKCEEIHKLNVMLHTGHCRHLDLCSNCVSYLGRERVKELLTECREEAKGGEDGS